MISILTVCTGNICRSPLAEHLLRAQIDSPDVLVRSAGTQGLTGAPMTEEAQHLARHLGAVAGDPEAHSGRYLTEPLLADVDIVLAMAREHRRGAVELDPSKLRVSFTVREFARLAGALSDSDLHAAIARGGESDHDRVRAAVDAVAGMRGVVDPPLDPTEDDVIDPYRKPWETYQLSASQLVPAIEQVSRVIRAALSAPAA